MTTPACVETAVSLLSDRLILGAPSSGPPFGRVAVFERTDGQWAVVQQIHTPRLGGGSTDGLFAWGVASATNFFAVSSVGFNLGGSGSVRIFRRNDMGNWLLDAGFGYIQPDTGPNHPMDLFGASLALTPGPPNGETLVVGAPGEASAATGVNGNESDDSAPAAGAAYVLDNAEDQ